ncbi:MAG: carbohydrate-binding domain-containing protein [Clostridia bacterium]|nr:carbohydrate-binding domain-containing protein [Clostridia bacterium]
MKTKLCALLLCGALLLTGCGKTGGEGGEEGTSSVVSASPLDTSSIFSDRDTKTDYDESKSVEITLNGTTITANSSAVTVDGNTATITKEGTYVLSGALDNGMIIVNTPKADKVQLVFNGVSIHSEADAPLYILQTDKVFLTLAENTENTLSNGGSFTVRDDNNIDAVIFSKEDLTINGSGKLTVQSPAGHGIVSKDELTITGGTLDIQSSGHGLTGKDGIGLDNTVLTVAAGKDGIHAEHDEDTTKGYVYIKNGQYKITAEGDGISASAQLQIDDGTFDIITGGGSENGDKQTSDNWGGFPGGGMGGGMGGGTRPNRPGGRAVTDTTTTDSTSIKGLKATNGLTIGGGTFTLNCADDAVHGNSDVTVSGGSFTIATGDDGFHADNTLTIAGGTIVITESYEGLEGLHVVVSGGDIRSKSSDDGINAAGGTDQSGMGGIREDQFGGGRPGGMGGPGGMGSASNGSITISGGKVYINASGDGIDANGTLKITGGYTVVCGPTQGDTATLDYDTSAVISGGTFIGTGASGMAQTFSSSENQGVIAISVGNRTAGTTFTLTNAAGEKIIDAFAPELSYAVVILSTPDIRKGESYTITVGSNTGTFEAD